MAASIRNDVLLHNLVVKPGQGKRNRYRVVVGERRFQVLKLLEDRGELPEDFTVTNIDMYIRGPDAFGLSIR